MATKIAYYVIYAAIVLMTFAMLDNVLSPDSFLKSENFLDNSYLFTGSLISFFGLVIYLQYQYKTKNIKSIF